METEKLNIFDANRKHLGVELREEVHRKGHWHETFHCWLVMRKEGEDWIYLQIRSCNKKDFPGLLDITAAGHLLATETAVDGIREVKEELGIAVDCKELVPLGIIPDRIHQADFIDNEHCHNFLYHLTDNSDLRFELQTEEVAGIVATKFQDFADLCLGEVKQVKVEGFEISDSGVARAVEKAIGKNDLVPHSQYYFEQLTGKIGQALEKQE